MIKISKKNKMIKKLIKWKKMSKPPVILISQCFSDSWSRSRAGRSWKIPQKILVFKQFKIFVPEWNLHTSTGFNLIGKKLIVISSILLRIHFHPFNQVKLHLIWSLFPICKSNQCLKPSLYLSARGNISIIRKIEIWSIYHWNTNINININSKPILTSL